MSDLDLELSRFLHLCSAMDPPAKPFPFLKLPKELRLQVYSYLFPNDLLLRYRLRKDDDFTHVDILQTCKQIHNEALEVLYELPTFTFSVASRLHGWSVFTADRPLSVLPEGLPEDPSVYQRMRSVLINIERVGPPNELECTAQDPIDVIKNRMQHNLLMIHRMAETEEFVFQLNASRKLKSVQIVVALNANVLQFMTEEMFVWSLKPFEKLRTEKKLEIRWKATALIDIPPNIQELCDRVGENFKAVVKGPGPAPVPSPLYKTRFLRVGDLDILFGDDDKEFFLQRNHWYLALLYGDLEKAKLARGEIERLVLENFERRLRKTYTAVTAALRGFSILYYRLITASNKNIVNQLKVLNDVFNHFASIKSEPHMDHPPNSLLWRLSAWWRIGKLWEKQYGKPAVRAIEARGQIFPFWELIREVFGEIRL
ncbi:hypothetical protein K402DRAFT_462116 [Aulographum hederae CBS 113979]|uniref:F-box domain-containing protein n=1 Tax=Aulographum hederae CBS 113979 TaxID=1176131 RepID=A0A6G1H4Z4_9PEZI|nr:hypothetical protein K402DRAFT_462116 [Aulographum hederae CBS 113979]